MNRKDFLASFKEGEDRLSAARVYDRMELSQKIFAPAFTAFMDPYSAHGIKALLCGFGCDILVYGGYEESERVMLGFFPEFSESDSSLFPITPIEISYNSKYSRTLTHRDFLGSVLGLGITREKTGDIITEEGRAVAFVDSEVADYIAVNLERVGHTKVNVRLLSSFTPKPSEAQEKRITLPSLRLDALLGGALNISRGRASELIKGEKVYINWKKMTSPSHGVAEGDIVTLRGMGRVRINEVIGMTKKDRVLINVSVFK